MIDCKTCKHGETLFMRDREDRFTTKYKPFGRVACSSPCKYKGRTFIVRDTRPACEHYEMRERGKP